MFPPRCVADSASLTITGRGAWLPAIQLRILVSGHEAEAITVTSRVSPVEIMGLLSVVGPSLSSIPETGLADLPTNGVL